MELKEERLQWKHDSANIDSDVNYVVETYKSAGAAPATYMALDLVYRPFIQWIHSAQIQNQDPKLVCNAVANIIVLQLFEIVMRMCSYEDGIAKSMELIDQIYAKIRVEVELDVITHFQALRDRPST